MGTDEKALGKADATRPFHNRFLMFTGTARERVMFSEVFDAFSRTDNQLRIKTRTGGVSKSMRCYVNFTVSILALIVMVTLFVTEVSIYVQTDVKTRLFVDPRAGEDIEINLDVSFPSLPCPCINSYYSMLTTRYQRKCYGQNWKYPTKLAR